jgi:DNA-binding MarR family transcriptional regulator
MASKGLVTREVEPADGRASLATLTIKGLQQLQEAWPAHLAGVRELVMNHIDPDDLAPDDHSVGLYLVCDPNKLGPRVSVN